MACYVAITYSKARNKVGCQESYDQEETLYSAPTVPAVGVPKVYSDAVESVTDSGAISVVASVHAAGTAVSLPQLPLASMIRTPFVSSSPYPVGDLRKCTPEYPITLLTHRED